MNFVKVNFIEFLTKTLNLSDTVADVLSHIILFLLVLCVAFLIGLVCRKWIVPVIQKVRNHTASKLDDYLLNDAILLSLCHAIPSFIIYLFLPAVFGDTPVLLDYMQRAAMIYIIIMLIRIFCIILDSLFSISKSKKGNKNASMKGFNQMLKIIVIFLGVIWILGTAIGKDPLGLIAGLGAAATILTFIFKDSIVGLVAGVQLTSNDMVKIGDWITVPGTSADGEVREINLTTVKVQNFDNTIVTIPPYTLVSGSFQNWKGMQSSGVRRVSRSVFIDLSSIHFCTPDEIKRFTKAGYLSGGEQEGAEPTNLDIYMEQLEKYLKNHPFINNSFTCMVRMLQPTAEGMPVQLYYFCYKNEWVSYEHIQTRIINYALCAAGEYNLRIYQSPSSGEIKKLNKQFD